MIDTITVTLDGVLKSAPLTKEWKRRKWSNGLEGSEGQFIAFPSGLLKHECGLRLGVDGGRGTWAEVEMSRLLYECNGKLIKTQPDLDQAVRNLVEILGQVCRLGDDESFPIRRIDLVGHANIAPETLLSAYKNFPLEGVHAYPVHYHKESLFWKGTKLKCRIYDKLKQQIGQAGQISRVEWELRGMVIAREFKRPLTLRTLSVADCYGVYCKLNDRLTPRQLLEPDKKMVTLLALAEKENWRSDGAPLSEIIKLWYKDRPYRRLMAQSTRATLKLRDIDLRKSFPSNFEDYKPVDIPLTFKRIS